LCEWRESDSEEGEGWRVEVVVGCWGLGMLKRGQWKERVVEGIGGCGRVGR
jgi:hypothetical protein